MGLNGAGGLMEFHRIECGLDGILDGILDRIHQQLNTSIYMAYDWSYHISGIFPIG